MHRPGTDPRNVQPDDILCDSRHCATRAQDIPSIEGRHGSIVSSDCPARAWTEVVERQAGRVSSPHPIRDGASRGVKEIGRATLNVAPAPGVDSRVTSAFSSSASSRQMANPSPVPVNSRVWLASA